MSDDEALARFGTSSAFAVAVATFISQQGNVISLHFADPGLTGANEITAPATRKATAWGAASFVTNVNDPNFGRAVVIGTAVEVVVPAGRDVTHYGVWSSGGVFQYGKPIVPAANFPVTGTASVSPTCAFGLT